jgi:hypothetical protein
MDKPKVVTREQLESPSAEQSAGMQRGEAFAHPGVWAGFATFPGDPATGWHHHGDYATYAYVMAVRICSLSRLRRRESVVGSSNVRKAVPVTRRGDACLLTD